MKKSAIKILLIIIGLIFLTNLNFIPGPNFLFPISNIFYNFGEIIGIFGLILVPIGIIWTVISIRKKKKENLLLKNLLWIVPLTLFFSTTFLSIKLREFSRNYAIKNANELINKIEGYKSKNGNYPENIESINPGIIGIKPYEYEKIDSNNYALKFYQNVILNFNYEIVVYDKNNKVKPIGESNYFWKTEFPFWKYEIYD